MPLGHGGQTWGGNEELLLGSRYGEGRVGGEGKLRLGVAAGPRRAGPTWSLHRKYRTSMAGGWPGFGSSSQMDFL